jgi:hypothetical protein
VTNRLFAERLNKELDSIGMPTRSDERIEAFSKLVKIPKFKAEAFLNGISQPDIMVLDRIAEEFEVSGEWLLGKTEHRSKKNA